MDVLSEDNFEGSIKAIPSQITHVYISLPLFALF